MSVERDGSVELLFVDDEVPVQDYVTRALKPYGFQVQTASDWNAARDLIGRSRAHPDVIFIDPSIRGSRTGVDLSAVCSEAERIPVIVLSALRDPKRIVQALRSGAKDYLCKPFDPRDLDEAVKRVLNGGNDAARPKQKAPLRRVDFIHCNTRMKQIYDMVLQIAQAHVPVLIHGESGVGKDVLARLIHDHSPRSALPFVKVNCAALPAELVESELFGHDKGAFTGAHTDRPGKFEFAHGGTIFLDEITEFSPAAQAKLLQVLQDKKFTRLGSNEEIEVDVRVVAATNRRIEESIEKGGFREDLYYRLNVVSLDVPPLRMRKDEIEPLSRFFLEKFAGEYSCQVAEIPAELQEAFRGYHWPGNVRELENIVKRFAVLQDLEGIKTELSSKTPTEMLDDVDEMTQRVLDEGGEDLDLKEIRRKAAAIVEKSMIRKTLQKTNWNKWQTAKALRVSYKTLLSKIEQHDIRP